MSDEREQRLIRTGTERHTGVTPFEYRWSVSKKGNPYTKIGDVVVSVFQVFKKPLWTFSWTLADSPAGRVTTGDTWQHSGEHYESVEEAKQAAIIFARLQEAKESDEPSFNPPRVAVRDESPVTSERAGEVESPACNELNRRIRL